MNKNKYKIQNSCIWSNTTLESSYIYKIVFQLAKSMQLQLNFIELVVGCFMIAVCFSYVGMNALANAITGVAGKLTTEEQVGQVESYFIYINIVIKLIILILCCVTFSLLHKKCHLL